jgi:hypothetical protein
MWALNEGSGFDGARAFVAKNALANVEIIEANAFASALSVGTFD